MLDKMGLNMQELGNIEEVVIKTDTKEIYLIKPQVIEMKGKDSTIFQIIAGDIEEKEKKFLLSRRKTLSSDATSLEFKGEGYNGSN
jgi:NACalpha-BTF3-like transcription factor